MLSSFSYRYPLHPSHARGLSGSSFAFSWRKTLLISGITIVLIVGLLFTALVGVIMVPTHWPATYPVTSPNPHVKHFYLALGDSLAFGFQPNFNWDQGYAEQWWPDLQRHGSKSFIDYGCNGETTNEFIHGGCPFAKVQHDYFSGTPLQAAVSFIKGHQGQVSPVSLDIGADDFLPLINGDTCKIDPGFKKKAAVIHRQLVTVILPQLLQALTVNGVRQGDLVMMNYYNPFANTCPDFTPFISAINKQLAIDAGKFYFPVVDVYAAFGGAQSPNPDVCRWTWMCSILHSIHPNSTGYGVITAAFEQKMGY